MVDVSYNLKKIILYHAIFFFNAITFLSFTLKIVVFNRKYIAEIRNPITLPVFDNYKADIYWNKLSGKKYRSPC